MGLGSVPSELIAHVNPLEVGDLTNIEVVMVEVRSNKIEDNNFTGNVSVSVRIYRSDTTKQIVEEKVSFVISEVSVRVEQRTSIVLIPMVD